MGYTGVNISFLTAAQNKAGGYSLEPPHWGGSNKYPQSMFWAEITKKYEYQNFYLKIFLFSVVTFSVYLNRYFLVMLQKRQSGYSRK